MVALILVWNMMITQRCKFVLVAVVNPAIERVDQISRVSCRLDGLKSLKK